MNALDADAMLWTDWRWFGNPPSSGTFVITETDGIKGWIRIRYHRSMNVERGWHPADEFFFRRARRIVATEEEAALLALQGVHAEVGKPDPDVLAFARGGIVL